MTKTKKFLNFERIYRSSQKSKKYGWHAVRFTSMSFLKPINFETIKNTRKKVSTLWSFFWHEKSRFWWILVIKISDDQFHFDPHKNANYYERLCVLKKYLWNIYFMILKHSVPLEIIKYTYKKKLKIFIF